jgi:hypothetical protein
VGAVAGAALLLPLGPAGSASRGFRGDVLVLIYLLALARFCTAWAAMETGSAFEGMGAVREVSYAVLAEAAIITAVLALSIQAGSLTARRRCSPRSAGAGAVLLAAGLFLVLLAENCRVPFDDPNTHLELTMIHEVMVLDHSGPPLAAILHGASMKLLLFSAAAGAGGAAGGGACLPPGRRGAARGWLPVVTWESDWWNRSSRGWHSAACPLLLTTAFLLCLFACSWPGKAVAMNTSTESAGRWRWP